MRQHGERGERAEDGFTLVELMVSIAILAVIAAPLTLGLMTGFRSIGRSEEKLKDSRSSLIASAYFAGDVSGANTIVPNDATACGGGTAIVTFQSSDVTEGVAGAVNNEVSYVIDATDATNKKLVRKVCAHGGAATQSVAAVSVGATPVVTCYDTGNVVNATCANAEWVKLVVVQKVNPATPDNLAPTAYTFTLAGTRRTQ